jgi:hypothetical protein
MSHADATEPAPEAPAALTSPPPADQPPRPSPDPSQELLALAAELIHTRNRQKLMEYLLRRRTM